MKDTKAEEETIVHMQRPAFKYEVNLTTIAALIGLFTAIWGASGRYNGLENQVLNLDEEAQVWRNNHMLYHQERAKETTAIVTRYDERLKSLETQSREFDRMEYRLTVQEQGTTSLTAAVADLRQIINDQSGDLRLIKEILQRIEKGSETPTTRR